MDAKQILVLGASALAAFSGGSATGKDSKEPLTSRFLPVFGRRSVERAEHLFVAGVQKPCMGPIGVK